MRPDDENGQESAGVRRSCALPLAWGLPDADRIDHLLDGFDHLLDGRRRPPIAAIREAMVMILLTLQTGRAREALIDIRLRHGDTPSDPCPTPAVLLTDGGDYILLAPIGEAPASSPSSEYRTIHDRIVLPLCRPLRRALASGMDGTIAEGPIFTVPPADLDRALRGLLRGGSDWRDRTVKAERGLTALARWLRHRLRVVEGGDPALCAILDSKRAGAERTVSAYATISADRYWRSYRKALSPIDGAIARMPPAALASLTYGDPRCPDDTALKTVLAHITRLSDRPLIRAVPSEEGSERMRTLGPLPIRRDCHLAKMIHCYAMATFGTGQRGIGKLVGLNEIDSETGFAWVVEKANSKGGYGGERAVFHCRSVRRQLAAYEDYVDHVAAALKRTRPDLAKRLDDLRAEGGIVFFDIRPQGLVPLSLGDLCRAAAVGINWKFDQNAGRRWLRSALIGRVPSDALAAQFGHHLDGLDIWSKHSGVHPHTVSEALGPAIERALATIGLAASPVKRCRASKTAAHAGTAGRRSARHRSGEILASAIWHGAMLDRDQEVTLIEKLHAASKQRSTLPEWIDFEDRYKKPYRRWFIDVSTRRLIDDWRAEEMPGIAGAPDDILREFLGPNTKVDDWHAGAVRRWRFRLPPLLHAQARGLLSNHSLSGIRFNPARGPKPAPVWTKGRRRRQPRETCDAFVSLLEWHWRIAGRPEPGRRVQPGQRKKSAHEALSRVLADAPVYRRMSPLERSLARGLVEGLQQDRRYLNPRGYSMTTIVKRAERLWRDFVPPEREEWEDRPIDELDGSTISRRIFPPMPWRGEVAQDLVTVLEALPITERSRATIDDLNSQPDNYTADILTPVEYDRAQEHGTEAWIGTALALCYRAGMRFEELAKIDRERILSDANGPSLLILDHRRTERLKTFHSRRRVPLDALLTNDERRSLASLIAAPLGRKGRIFPYLRIDDPAVGTALRRAAGDGMRVFPLRHAFATNALAAMLWPGASSGRFDRFFDPVLLERRAAFRRRLCGTHSLGGCAPHAVACMMGHTSPHRTLFSYAHHLEIILAAHVERYERRSAATCDSIVSCKAA